MTLPSLEQRHQDAAGDSDDECSISSGSSSGSTEERLHRDPSAGKRQLAQQEQEPPYHPHVNNQSAESKPQSEAGKVDSGRKPGLSSSAAASNNPTTTIPKNKIPSRKTKKRSRKDVEDLKDQEMALKQDRYQKLLYMAKKQLTKQAKLVRSFMVQRNIRKLKNGKKNESNNDEQPKSFQPLKDLSLELVVQQAFRQLGLIHANPDPEASFTPPPPPPADQAKLVSSVLDHKRFQSTLEEWNEKVADFRRFCLSLDDRDNKFASQDSLVPKKKRGKKGKTSTATTSLRAADSKEVEPQTSVFCNSLNDAAAPPLEDNDMAAYGPAATMDDSEFQKPKNRQGQRARKAKAIAIQAKKEGRQYQSLNWREEKKNNKDEDTKKGKKTHANKPASKDGSEKKTATDGKHKSAAAAAKPHEDPASQHPSWAAKQQQKTGIVAFQGKKITFD